MINISIESSHNYSIKRKLNANLSAVTVGKAKANCCHPDSKRLYVRGITLKKEYILYIWGLVGIFTAL